MVSIPFPRLFARKGLQLLLEFIDSAKQLPVHLLAIGSTASLSDIAHDAIGHVVVQAIAVGLHEVSDDHIVQHLVLLHQNGDHFVEGLVAGCAQVDLENLLVDFVKVLDFSVQLLVVFEPLLDRENCAARVFGGNCVPGLQTHLIITNAFESKESFENRFEF
jgi:hypothetical protein